MFLLLFWLKSFMLFLISSLIKPCKHTYPIFLFSNITFFDKLLETNFVVVLLIGGWYYVFPNMMVFFYERPTEI